MNVEGRPGQFDGQNPRSLPDRLCGPPSLFKMGTASFPGIERPKGGVDHPPHLLPKLKKESSYTCTPPLCLHGLF